jgi:arabinofuranosyltransferase
MTLTAVLWATQAISVAALVGVWRFRGRFGVALVLACAIAILILHGYFFWDYTADDAFISFRYSLNFAHGNGLVWNPGERVEGYSNFLWVLLLAGTEFVGLGIVEPSRWLGFGASAGTLVVLYGLAQELSQDRREAELTFTASALLLVSTAPFSMWTFAGLEEPLFAFLVTLTLYVHIREDRLKARYPWSAAVALAAALTRPEGLLLALLVLALKALPLRAAASRRERWRFGAVWALAFAVPYAVFIGWRLSYYGYPLPNTYYQKLDGPGVLSGARYEDGYTYVRAFWEQYGLLLLFPLPLFALLRSSAIRAAVPLLAFVSIWIMYVVYVGGDFEQFFRFAVPVLPIAYLLSVHVVISGVQAVPSGVGRRAATALLPIGLLATIAWVMHVPQENVNAISFLEATAFQREDIANWLRTQDRAAVVAVSAAGQIPYWSGSPSIDMLGLSDEHIAHQPAYTSGGVLVPGHKKGDGRYVLDRRPDIIVIAAGLTLFPESAFAWRTKVALLPAENDILTQPDLWDLYEPAWVKVPRGVFNFLRLKGSEKVIAEPSPPLSESEAQALREKDLPGSCDNSVLPRPPPTIDYGYFYLTNSGVVAGVRRRAVTEYRTDAPGSPTKVIEHYKEYMALSHWTLTGTTRGEPKTGAGNDFTVANFQAGVGPIARTAFVAISDDGERLITSTDFVSPTEKQSLLYRCAID